MPYVPSKKTDGKSTDREVIDLAVEKAAREAAGKITTNLSVITTYKDLFFFIVKGINSEGGDPARALGKVIYEVGERYGYEGAYLGELNYAITRFIQRVPQIKVEMKDWEPKDELRYWLYAATIEALTYTADKNKNLSKGISGVFEDIKDEYKRRVNTAYEAAQIIKSGDCYDTPYYTRIIEVVDESGKPVGHMEVMLKRNDETLHQNILDGQLVIKKKPSGSKGPGI